LETYTGRPVEPSSKKTSPTDGRRVPVRTRIVALSASMALALAALAFAAEEPAPVPAPADSSPGATTPPASPAAGDAAPVMPASPEAVAPVDERSPITVEADALEVEKDGVRVRATGSVEVQWDTTKLSAGEIFVDQRERRIEARGGVRYESDEIRATAASAKLDVDAETGVLDDVEMHLVGESGRFGGERLEKAEGRHVLLDDGYFTTCETDLGHPPDWELRGKHLDVRFDDYARMKAARLEIRGVPVFYLPYLIFPTKQTRQSGVLPFFLGTSTNRGFMFSLPGYWAIDKHQDLTATAVVETSARLGVDSLYRYNPSRDRWGEFHGSYYNEEIRGEAKPNAPAVGVPDNRGSVEWIHREHGRRWTGYTDVQWISDERFLREVTALEGDAPERELRRSRRYTASRAGVIGASGFTSGGIDVTAYQDLVGTLDEDGDPDTKDPVRRDTLYRPMNGWLQTDANLGPLALAVDSSVAAFVRDKGASGERLDVASTLALPLLVEGPLRSRAWVKGRGSVYAMTNRTVLNAVDDPTVAGDVDAKLDRLDAFPVRGVFEGGIDTRTKFAREYAFSDSVQWTGLYHSLEPFAALRYTNRSTGDEIPLFDRLDAIDGRDVATYGVDSRFLLRHRPGSSKRSNGSPFEFGRLSLSQSYNLSYEVVDDQFSDIDISAFIQPVEGFAVRTLTSWNVGAGEVRGANASLSWETGPFGPLLRGPNSQIAAAYRYVSSDSAEDVLQSTEVLARLAFTKNISIGLKGLYDIVSNNFVEKAIGVTFTSSCDCWSVGVGVVDRVNPAATGNFASGGGGSPNETQVRLAFELTGLGGFGSSVTQRSSPALSSVEYDDIGFWRAGW
jgi:LPS-assembly protein